MKGVHVVAENVDDDFDPFARAGGIHAAFADDAESFAAGGDARGELLEDVAGDALDFEQAGDVREVTGGGTVIDDVLGELFIEAVQATENRERGGVDVDEAFLRGGVVDGDVV